MAAEKLSLMSSFADNERVDGHVLIVLGVRMKTLLHKLRAKDGHEGAGNVVAKGGADGAGTFIGHPVA